MQSAVRRLQGMTGYLVGEPVDEFGRQIVVPAGNRREPGAYDMLRGIAAPSTGTSGSPSP